MNDIITIAIDGPAGAGKSAVSKRIAEKMGIRCLDTGAYYRTLGLYMVRNGIDTKDCAACEAAVTEVPLKVCFIDGVQHMFLADEDVSGLIRTNEISMASSNVSAHPGVRRVAVKLQQEFAAGNSVVIEGRDICTVVLPDATAKIFLTATPEERARRRLSEQGKPMTEENLAALQKEINERDYQDMHRKTTPLIVAPDAVTIVTDGMTIEQEVDEIIAIALKNQEKKRASV